MDAPGNLLLLTVDAWRPDFVEELAGVRLAPSLDRLPWWDFANAYSTGPWTTPGLVSILTGEAPTRHGVTHSWSAPREGGPALFRTLREAGWHVPNLCYLNALDNYSRLGFSREDAPPPPPDASDPTLLEALAATPEPFALWYHYRFLHLPYWAPEPFRRRLDVLEVDPRLRGTVGGLHVLPRASHRLDREDTETIRRLYAAGVLEFDAFLERVLDALERRKVGDRTTVVLTSDHGEELMEHGHVGHASTALGATLYEEVLRVPLRISDPRIGARREEARVQTSDLYRTLLSLLGRPDPQGDGVDLWTAGSGLPRDRVLAFHSSVHGFQTPRELGAQRLQGWSDGRRKVILERREDTRILEFDLEADPGERAPRQEEAPRATREALYSVGRGSEGIVSRSGAVQTGPEDHSSAGALPGA